LVQEGYQYWFKGDILVTVWSAPNYFYRCGNTAAILELDENLDKNFKTFKEVAQSAKSVNPKFVLPYFL
jgi:serine/threonine-protein phosphatase 6 catalytic subunit